MAAYRGVDFVLFRAGRGIGGASLWSMALARMRAFPHAC
jgi:hypothetical protein